MSTIGEKPRPRALLLGLEQREADMLSAFFPTYLLVSDLGGLRQAEWDVLVTRQPTSGLAPHIFVLALGNGTIGPIKSSMDLPEYFSIHCSFSGTSYASEFVIPPDLPSEILRLVELDLLPRLQAERKHTYFIGGMQHAAGMGGFSNYRKLSPADFRPFILTADNEPLAGIAERVDGDAEAWYLPYVDVDLTAWVKAALRHWHKKNPARFPINPGWEHQPEWMTLAEMALTQQLRILRKQHQEAVERFLAQQQELTTGLHQARQEADANERRLLTAQAESLVKAVQQALLDLGFEVQNMDEVFPERDRREDLRVQVSGMPSWVAICEVKGYYKGAKINDLMKLASRFRERFFLDHQRFPERSWYIVNTFLQDDPSVRRKPLSENADEVETFAASGGLVLSTTALFRMVRAVKSKRLSHEDARSTLRNAVGVFDFRE